MTTRARRDGDHYVVDGTKTFITNGINADLVIVAVKTDPSERHRGISLLVVERGMEGFERGRNLEKIGQHAQDTAELSFAEVRVPVENLLGEEGRGFATSSPTSPRSGSRSPPRPSRPPRPRWAGRSSTCASARPSASRSARFRTRASRSPRSAPKSRSRAPSSTAAPGAQRRRADPEDAAMASGGAPTCRAASSTAACSCHGGYGYMLEYPIARAYADAG